MLWIGELILGLMLAGFVIILFLFMLSPLFWWGGWGWRDRGDVSVNVTVNGQQPQAPQQAQQAPLYMDPYERRVLQQPTYPQALPAPQEQRPVIQNITINNYHGAQPAPQLQRPGMVWIDDGRGGYWIPERQLLAAPQAEQWNVVEGEVVEARDEVKRLLGPKRQPKRLTRGFDYVGDDWEG